MTIEVHLPTLLRPLANNQATITAEGNDLRAVFASIGQSYPALAERLKTEDGELHKFMNVYLNDDDVRFLNKLDTPVKEGDTITILPAVAGGCGGITR